ncbi:MAG: serine protease [Verrucomicrobiae bacterium]|nr:serine protease [Verrucomicrobiae bacterium]
MKAILLLIIMEALTISARGDGLTRTDDNGLSHVEIDGKTYSDISGVYVSGDKVIINYPTGGTSVPLDKVPADFLGSWGITSNQLAEAKSKITEATIAQTEHAIQAGCFRAVNGVVYDTRKAQSKWVRFSNVKIYQIVDDGALVDTTPGNLYDTVPILVKNLPTTVGDRDYIHFTALQVGTYDYINKLGDSRTVRAYDCGRVCDRSEIPRSVLEGKAAFAELEGENPPTKSVITTLPDSENLQACGSGFFISKDGYFITNDHVVKNARRVKLKIAGEVYAAEIVREDVYHDLALLKAEGRFEPLCVADEDADLGQAVFTIGFPDIQLQGTEPKYTDGKISSSSGIQDDPNQFQISVPVQPGNSGGPLADFSGKVRGVIVARLDDMAALRSSGTLPQNVNYAIKGSILRQFLKESSQIQLVTSGSSGVPAVKMVKQAVALVLRY